MGFTTTLYNNTSTNNSLGTLPSYNLPEFQKPAPLPSIALPTYQNPGSFILPEFEAPDMDEYIKTLDIPGVKIEAPAIDKQFIKEWTQEYSAPAMSEERTSFRDALTEARKYSDNPAVIAKVIRDLMRTRGTGISKILGEATRTAANQEAANRAQLLNVAVNNANLEQTRNLAEAKAQNEIGNKEIAERNQRKYAEVMDAYQKTVQDMMNQRNAASSYNNQAAMSEYERLMQDAMNTRQAESSYNTQKAFTEADRKYAAEMAAWENAQKQESASTQKQPTNPYHQVFL